MIADFLSRYRPGGPWHLVAITPDAKGKGTLDAATFMDSTKAEAWARSNNSKKRNVYFSVNPTAKPINTKASKADMARLEWLHVDIDPRAGEDFDAERARITSLLNGGRPKDVPAPSLVIDSGGGFQAFWRLAEPTDLNGDPENIARAEAYNVALANRLGGDHCANIDRIMRLPWTTNWPDARKRKRGRVPREAEVYSRTDASYSLGAFPLDARRQVAPTRTPTAAAAAPLPDGVPMGTAELTAWAEAHGKVVNDATLARIATGDDPMEPGKYPSRSEAVFAVCCELVRAGIPDDVIFAAIMDPGNAISESVLEKPDRRAYAQRQIERARQEAIDPWLRKLNDDHAVLLQEGGKCRVLAWEERKVNEADPNEAPRLVPVLQSFEDFRNRYRNKKVQVGLSEQGKPIEKQVGTWWLDHSQRREYRELRFLPGKPQEVGPYLNLWRGWSVVPSPGNWSLMREHIETILAGGDAESSAYILRWAAWAVQHPERMAEAALILRGGRGTGKGMFARALKDLFGQHGLQISLGGQITGRFNSHLRDCCLLFADEAVVPGDKAGEKALNALITEPEIAIEGKGVNVVATPNHLHVVMASNERWVVPAALDERRFAVFDVADAKAQNKAYFSALVKQMEAGGLAAMLHDLLTMDLGDWHPRWNIPQTLALMEQKTQSLPPLEAVVYRMLYTGELPTAPVDAARTFVPTTSITDRVERRFKGIQVAPQEVGALLGGNGMGFPHVRKRNGGGWGYWFPPIKAARTSWTATGRPGNWDDDIDCWTEWDHSAF